MLQEKKKNKSCYWLLLPIIIIISILYFINIILIWLFIYIFFKWSFSLNKIIDGLFEYECVIKLLWKKRINEIKINKWISNAAKKDNEKHKENQKTMEKKTISILEDVLLEKEKETKRRKKYYIDFEKRKNTLKQDEKELKDKEELQYLNHKKDKAIYNLDQFSDSNKEKKYNKNSYIDKNSYTKKNENSIFSDTGSIWDNYESVIDIMNKRK